MNSNSAHDTTAASSNMIIEEQDVKLMTEEKQLIEELKQLQDKHRNVRLVYEKVMDNLKIICRYDSKKEDTINITQSHIVNLNESKVIDSSNFQNQSSFHIPPAQLQEEDVLKSYSDFLDTTKKTIDTLFLNHSREEFLLMMRGKGIGPTLDPNNRARPTIPTSKRKQSSAHNVNLSKMSEKQLSKDLTPKPTSSGNDEYGYSDEELRKEDDEIKQEKDEIMKQFKAVVNKDFFILFFNFRKEQGSLKP